MYVYFLEGPIYLELTVNELFISHRKPRLQASENTSLGREPCGACPNLELA